MADAMLSKIQESEDSTMVDPTSSPFDKFAHTDELHLLRTHLIWDRKWYDDLELDEKRCILLFCRKCPQWTILYHVQLKLFTTVIAI
jgi:hypothetical protein